MFAKEGLPFMAGATAIAAVLGWAASATGSIPLLAAAILAMLIAGWVAWFFRNPERSGPRGEALVIAPADGMVVLITPIEEPTFVHGPTVRVSIFMNVFSVHVNRFPVSGTVRYVVHKAGKFLNAMVPASSDENEQASVGIECGAHRILVRQIAGLIARRIITDPRVGDPAEQGARFGLIRFGSRVDVFLPPDAALQVRVGQRTEAGRTVIAQLPPRP